MPNTFKKSSRTNGARTSGADPAPDATISAVTRGELGFLGNLQIKHQERKARRSVKGAALAAVENEALAVVKSFAEAEGRAVRAEAAKLHAQAMTIIANDLSANSAAGFQALGATRVAGGLSNYQMRGEMMAEVERVIASSGTVTEADRVALIELVSVIHSDVEGDFDAVYEGARQMTQRAYAAATATTSEINDK